MRNKRSPAGRRGRPAGNNALQRSLHELPRARVVDTSARILIAAQLCTHCSTCAHKCVLCTIRRPRTHVSPRGCWQRGSQSKRRTTYRVMCARHVLSETAAGRRLRAERPFWRSRGGAVHEQRSSAFV